MIPAAIQRQLEGQLADRAPAANIVQAAAAFITWLMLRPFQLAAVTPLCVALAAVGIARALIIARTVRPVSRRALWLMRAGSLAGGALWSAVLYIGIVQGSPDVRAVMIVIAIGAITGASHSLFTDLTSMGVFSAPITLSTIVALAALGQRTYVYAALAMLIFGALILVSVVGRLNNTLEGIAKTDSLTRQAEELERVNAELRHARESALAGMASRQMFLANVSHEIRTPLNGIMGMTGLLLETELDSDQLECTATVRTCASSLLQLINDILDFSKMDAGRLELENRAFDLLVVIEDVMDIVADRARQRGLTLECRIDPTLPRSLEGDPGRLRQVLLNLAGNAIKFTEEGEVVLDFKRLSAAEGRCELAVAIRDTGIGIGAEEQARLFKPFSQVDSSMTRRHGGTGLGLVISQQIVQRMGGSIGVESEAGHGSTFRFTVTLGIPPDTPAIGWTAPLVAFGTRVLVADSNATGRDVLVAHLRAAGLDVTSIADPRSTAAVLSEAAGAGRPFRIALVALRDSGLTADVLVREVKQDELNGATDLVMLAPMGFRGDEARMLRKGFSGFLSLPVKRSRLEPLLEAILTGMRPVVTERRAQVRGQGSGLAVRILLAEDNPVNQKVAVRVLERLGYEADVAPNGVEALRMLAKGGYDALVTDVQMPEMDGLALAREVRRLESGGTRLPVIAMTAHASPRDRELCLEAGMDDYVSKPISPDDLARVLERWLPRATGEDSTRVPVPEAAESAGARTA